MLFLCSGINTQQKLLRCFSCRIYLHSARSETSFAAQRRKAEVNGTSDAMLEAVLSAHSQRNSNSGRSLSYRVVYLTTLAYITLLLIVWRLALLL
jgi:hypothetical protein